MQQNGTETIKLYRDHGGCTYLVPMRKITVCMVLDFNFTLPGRGSPASDSLKEVIRTVKLGLPCQILGQCRSRPPARTVSCWGRSLGHSIGPLDCMDGQLSVSGSRHEHDPGR